MSEEDNDITLDDSLHVRISKQEKNIFKNKCKRIGKPYQLLTREIVSAFNDGRLRIIPTETQSNSLGELYNVTGK